MDSHTVEWRQNARESKAKPLYSERLRIYLSRTFEDRPWRHDAGLPTTNQDLWHSQPNLSYQSAPLQRKLRNQVPPENCSEDFLRFLQAVFSIELHTTRRTGGIPPRGTCSHRIQKASQTVLLLEYNQWSLSVDRIIFSYHCTLVIPSRQFASTEGYVKLPYTWFKLSRTSHSHYGGSSRR
jgi:hypothetical protein